MNWTVYMYQTNYLQYTSTLLVLEVTIPVSLIEAVKHKDYWATTIVVHSRIKAYNLCASYLGD